MSMTENISGQSRTLLPAKEPAVNPWLQRRLLKPPTSTETSHLSTTKNSNWPSTTASSESNSDVSKENLYPLNDHNTGTKLDNNGNIAATTTTTTNSAKSDLITKPSLAQKIKPTAKEKWVPYDATIIVDSTGSSGKKKTNNKKKKSNNNKKKTEKEDGKDDKPLESTHSRRGSSTNITGAINNNTSTTKRKMLDKNGKWIDGSNIRDSIELSEDDLTTQISSMVITDSAVEISNSGDTTRPQQYTQEDGIETNLETLASPPPPPPQKIPDVDPSTFAISDSSPPGPPPASHSLSPSLPDERRSSSRRSSNKLYYNSDPKFRRSSSQMNSASPMIQPPMYSPMMPQYLYQPLYQPYFPQPPSYPMNSFNNGKYGTRGSRNNSSSSSLNETISSPSSPPPPPPPMGMGYNKNSEPFFPQQQYMGYYTIPPQQAVYPMMPPPPHMPSYMHDGSPLYMSPPTGKRKSRSQELFPRSRSNSTVYDRASEVAAQLDYYFSKENLIKDIYLRSNMKDGFVNLKVIANFLRFKALTGGDLNLAINSLSKCTNIEYKVVNDEYFLKSRFEYFFKK